MVFLLQQSWKEALKDHMHRKVEVRDFKATMKEKTTASSKKKPSVTDERPSDRRLSNITNPYLLPEFDEENYDLTVAPTPSATEVPKTVPTVWKKQSGGALSFKKVAKAITKQRKWSSVLKVKSNFKKVN